MPISVVVIVHVTLAAKANKLLHAVEIHSHAYWRVIIINPPILANG